MFSVPKRCKINMNSRFFVDREHKILKDLEIEDQVWVHNILQLMIPLKSTYLSSGLLLPGGISRPWLCPSTLQKNQWSSAPKTPSPWMGSFFSQRALCPPLFCKCSLFVNSRAKLGWAAACWSPRMHCNILLRAPGRLLHAVKDESFGNCSASWSQICSLHHAHTVAITFSFLCGLTYCVRTLLTVSAKLSRAWSNSSYFWWSSIDVCIHICKYVCIHVCTNAHMFVCVYICMYIGAGHLCVCMYVCMYLQSEKTHM